MTIVGMALALTGMPKNALAEEVSVEADKQPVSVAVQATDEISSEETVTEDANDSVEVQSTDDATSTDETTLETSKEDEAVIAEAQTNDTVVAETAEEDTQTDDEYFNDKQKDYVQWYKDQLAENKDAFDKQGTTIDFDFNGDGKTDAQDYIDFEMYHSIYESYFADTDWVKLQNSNGDDYVYGNGNPIWFNYAIDENGNKIYFVQDGDTQWVYEGENADGSVKWSESDKKLVAKFGKGINGGLWLTGYLQMALNGNGQNIEIDESLNLDKVKSYYLNNILQSTDVKNQAWFGNCWAFANTAALESAILKAKAGDTADLIDIAKHVNPKLTGLKNDEVDLSELMIAWYGYIIQQSGSQAGEGEGFWPDADHPGSDAAHFQGGAPSICESLWTAFQGLATEDEVPYWPQDKETGEFLPFTYDTFKRCWKNVEGHDFKWSPVKANDGKQIPVHIKGVKYLPMPNKFELVRYEDGTGIVKWVGHDKQADLAIKQALVKHGAVSVAYNADISLGDGGANTDFINKENYAQYQDTDYMERTHFVTIVGWDDNYDKNNFATGVNDPSKIENGAWLCKNSWGSYDFFKDRFGLEGDDNPATWGIKDENGNPTGFFWLSYYDHTISYVNYFDVELPDENGEFKTENVYAYDFSRNGADNILQLHTEDTGTEVANVFTANKDEQLKQVSVRTAESDCDVHVRIYLIDANDNLDDFDPTNGSEAVVDFTTHSTVSGFQLIDLPEFVNLKAGQKFAIVENIVSKSHKDASKQVSYIALETSLNGYATSDDYPESGLHYVCNDGESFVKVLTKDGYKWMSPKQLDENYFDGFTFIFGNALIKAYTADIPVYQVIDGDAQVVQSNKLGDVTFKFDGDFKHFEKVLVDGVEVSADNYKAVEGSTVITFNNDFMKTLESGEHTVTAVYNNGAEAAATFSMIKMADESTQTDDQTTDSSTQTDGDNAEDVKDKDKGPKPLPTPHNPKATEKKAAKAELPQTGDMAILPELVAAAVAAFGIGYKKRDEE